MTDLNDSPSPDTESHENTALTVRPTNVAVTTPSDDLRSRADRTIAIMERLSNTPPEQIAEIVKGVIQVSQSIDPTLLMMQAEAERRRTGMWIGAAMTTVTITGGVAVLISSTPALIGGGLLCLGAACAGATYALIAGTPIHLDDFSKLLNSAKGMFTIAGHEEKK